MIDGPAEGDSDVGDDGAAAGDPATAGGPVARAGDARATLVLGSLTVDDLVRPDGVTQMGQLGGAAPYAAIGAALTGAPASVWAWCGAADAAWIRGELRRAGLQDDALVERDRPQPRAWQLFEADGTRTEVFRTDWPDVRRHYPEPTELPARTWRRASLFGPRIGAYAASARARGAAVVTWEPPDDLCRREQAQEVFAQLEHCDVVTPNVGEWTHLVGSNDAEVIADRALAVGVALVAVRLGENGMLLATTSHRTRLPAAGLEDEVDLTGAGNAFSGAIAANVASDPATMSVVELQRLGARAAVAAAMTIESQGLPVADDAAQRRCAERVVAYLAAL